MSNLSIITATYNVEQSISSCLGSLKSQTVPFEHLVIDGLSKDSTLEIIKGMSSGSKIISEPDNGLYDALNKGIRTASGDVIGILHADDFYADEKVLARVAEVFEDPKVDACYSDLLYIQDTASNSDEQFKVIRYWRSGKFNTRKFYWGWMPPHPTFFVRKPVYEKYGLFNLDLGTAADYELMLRFLLKHQIKCQYIPKVLVKMRVGGVSNASLGNRLRANRMDREAWRVNGLKPYPWTIPMKPIRKIPQYFLKPPISV